MTMVFQRIQTEGIAQLSCLIGDDGAGTAAVIDPRPDAGSGPANSASRSQTHFHADFMSEARELVYHVPGSLQAWKNAGFELEK